MARERTSQRLYRHRMSIAMLVVARYPREYTPYKEYVDTLRKMDMKVPSRSIVYDDLKKAREFNAAVVNDQQGTFEEMVGLLRSLLYKALQSGEDPVQAMPFYDRLEKLMNLRQFSQPKVEFDANTILDKMENEFSRISRLRDKQEDANGRQSEFAGHAADGSTEQQST